MARLLTWPTGLRWNRWKWLSGPESVGAASSTTSGDFTQTVATPFGARHIQLSFPPLRGKAARRARGLVTALHKGANAVRVGICDWDGMTLVESGMDVSRERARIGTPWNNGPDIPASEPPPGTAWVYRTDTHPPAYLGSHLGGFVYADEDAAGIVDRPSPEYPPIAAPFDNGENFRITKPNVTVQDAAALGATVVQLSDEWWGHDLGVGDWVGFFPFHFGLYEVTEVIDDGRYRIWPPLRKAVAAGGYATQYPVMSMRLKSDNLPDADRGPAFLEGLTISLFEVFDYDTRDYFDD